MLYLLRPGDRLRLRRVRASQMRWGDVVIVFQGDAQAPLLVHRLVWRSHGGVWRTKGDSSLRLDPPAPETALAWRVEAYRRGDGAWRELDAPAERLRQAACVWAGGLLIGLPTLAAAAADRARRLLPRRAWLEFWDRRRHDCCVLAAELRNFFGDRVRHAGLLILAWVRDRARASRAHLAFLGARVAAALRPTFWRELTRRAFFAALRARLGPVPGEPAA